MINNTVSEDVKQNEEISEETVLALERLKTDGRAGWER